jgi:ribonucleoside-triphosphate reductase
MVPYVRKSFAKHYKDGLKYVEDIDLENIDYEIENMLKAAKDYSIEDSEYQAYAPGAYSYALDMTLKETH